MLPTVKAQQSSFIFCGYTNIHLSYITSNYLHFMFAFCSKLNISQVIVTWVNTLPPEYSIIWYSEHPRIHFLCCLFPSNYYIYSWLVIILINLKQWKKQNSETFREIKWLQSNSSFFFSRKNNSGIANVPLSVCLSLLACFAPEQRVEG